MQPEIICIIFGVILFALLYYLCKNIYNNPKNIFGVIILVILVLGFFSGAISNSCSANTQSSRFNNQCQLIKTIGQPFLKFASLFIID